MDDEYSNTSQSAFELFGSQGVPLLFLAYGPSPRFIMLTGQFEFHDFSRKGRKLISEMLWGKMAKEEFVLAARRP